MAAPHPLEALCTSAADGGPYPRELIEDALALMILNRGEEPSEAGSLILGHFALRAGVRPQDDAQNQGTAIARYAAGLAFPPGLLLALDRILGGLGERAKGEAVSRFAAFAGETFRAKPTTKEGGGIPGGLARLRAADAIPKRRSDPTEEPT